MSTILADRYVLETEIARGAVGVVWRGLDRIAGEPVAVKVLREEMRSRPEIVESFFAEAEILNAIDHPGVVGVQDFVVTDAVLAVVIDLIDGIDLREHLRRHGPLAPAEAARRCASAAETLAAVHRTGYLHGDVKPGNLMLTGAGVTFVDFGIARAAGNDAKPSHGTPEYAAPEVAAGESACPGSDGYALGLVLYEALTGHSAYRGGSVADVLDRQLTKVPVRPAAVDSRLWAVVESLLELDPGRRAGLEQVAAGLRALAPDLSEHPTAPIEPELRDRDVTSAIDHSPVTPPAPRPGARDVAVEAPRRRGLLLAGAGALGTAAIAAFVLFVMPDAGPSGPADAVEPSGAVETTAPSEPSDEPSEAPTEADDTGSGGSASPSPGANGTETDSAADGSETDGLSGSDDGGSAPAESNEGTPVELIPGSDVIGSRLPGN
ncbi:hypothetical protein GCM10027447_01500 [Glycomyces halotolerans]